MLFVVVVPQQSAAAAARLFRPRQKSATKHNNNASFSLQNKGPKPLRRGVKVVVSTSSSSSSSSSSSHGENVFDDVPSHVEPSDAPGEGKKRFPNANEESRRRSNNESDEGTTTATNTMMMVEPRKYKHPGNEGRAVTYSFDVDAVGTFRGLVDVKYDDFDDDFDDGARPTDAPGEGKRRAPDAGQEREKDDGWDAKKGHGLMFGYVEERKEEMEF